MMKIVKRESQKESQTKKKNFKRFISVLIADDHPYLVSGVETDLNKDAQIKIVGAATNYSELLEKAEELKPDIVLLDLKMPGSEVTKLEEYIPKLKLISGCKVVIFTNETGWARVHRCLEIGAQAYVEKAISIGKLSEVVRHVHEKDDLIIFTSEEIPEIEFSLRQEDVLNCIADGVENKEIAKILNIEIATVHSYIDDIKNKFSVAFNIYPVRPRTLMVLASKLGYGHMIA